MNERRKWTIVLATITVFVTTAAFLPGLVCAGNLEPSESPDSTMHTLDEIYHKLQQLTSPGLVPVTKTGQTNKYADGDDGDLKKGVAWPVPRFTDNGDGTVTDNLTGLIWLKKADCFGERTWTQALSDCNNLADGSCGLTDGSSAGDWRLPNVRELQSLIDYGRYGPALPAGHPFTNVQSSYYCSSRTYALNASLAWLGLFGDGLVAHGDYAKDYDRYVWCV
jgi:hypothetical protein